MYSSMTRPILLVLIFATFSAAARPSLVINKCCPLGQSLTYASPMECAPVKGSSENASSIRSETASALLERYPLGYAPWMDSELKLHDENTLEPLNVSLLEGHLPGAYVGYGAHEMCPDEDRQVISTAATYRYKLLADGRLLMNLSTWGGVGEVSLERVDYCVDRIEKTSALPNGAYVFLACPCKRVLCLRKCCRPQMAFADSSNKAACRAPTPEEQNRQGSNALDWRPVFRNNDLSPTSSPMHHLLVARKISCPNGVVVLLNEDEADRMWVFPNGSALMESFGYGVPYERGRWCGEKTLVGNGSVLENALFCHETREPEPIPADVQILGVLFLSCAFFLLLTLCVYAVLPELRAPAHAKALMSHCAALLAGSMVLGTMQLSRTVPDELCPVGAISIQFCFLASFFWLNVLCVDISWAFSGLRGLLGSLLDTSRRKFLYYSLYAWGCPFIITAVTVGLHIGDVNGSLPEWVVVPNFGKKICWFYDAPALWAFFYGPMAALLMANTMLFVFTAGRLACAQCDSEMLNRGDSVRHDRSSRMSAEKRRFILYTKLFLLMGVTWILEVASWCIQQDQDDSSSWWWMISDVLNAGRGFMIFVIFCCKAKVVRMLRKRLDAWGLPGGLPPGADRSPTYRSQLSTRQSSMLQLSPNGDISFAGQRLSSVPATPPPDVSQGIVGFLRRLSAPQSPSPKLSKESAGIKRKSFVLQSPPTEAAKGFGKLLRRQSEPHTPTRDVPKELDGFPRRTSAPEPSPPDAVKGIARLLRRLSSLHTPTVIPVVTDSTASIDSEKTTHSKETYIPPS